MCAHPPAAAACRQVLPRVSGVSIWKPAHRTESLHIMLNLRPDEGSTTGREEAGQTTHSGSHQRGREREGEREGRGGEKDRGKCDRCGQAGG